MDPIVIVIGEEDEIPIVTDARARRVSRWSSRTIGIAATVLFHLLVSAPLILGAAAHKKRPSPDGIGSTPWASQGEQSESMILLDLSAMSASADLELPQSKPAESAISTAETLVLLADTVKPPDDLKFEDDTAKDDESSEAAGDPAGQAALFGKYMGQVGARIERAWMRPRTAIDNGHFDCRARVMQDRQGNVLSISLEDCGSNEPWRKSLTSAILRASPLSAPPEPWLFSAALTLNFSGEQYLAGTTPEYEYEPLMTRVAMSQSHMDATSQQIPGSGTGDFELTINGSDVRWVKKEESVTTPR